MSLFTWVERANSVSHLPPHVVNDWVGVGVGGDVLVVLGFHPERDHVVPERPGHTVLAQTVWLMFQDPSRAGHGDLHALVAVVCPEEGISPVNTLPPSSLPYLLKVLPHVGVETDIFLSKSLNEIFFGRDLEGGGSADQKSNNKKFHPASCKWEINNKKL